MSEPSGPLTQSLDDVRAAASGAQVSVGEIIDALKERGLLPIILVPATVAATPLSGIPGLSAFCGIMIAILSFELLLGFRKVRLPRKMRSRSIDADKLANALSRIEPVIHWVERRTRRRLSVLFHRPLVWIPQALCLATGLAMPFLEIIPFSASAAAIAVCFLVVAMLTADGLFFILALLPYAGLGFIVVRMTSA
ncbi:exopolysaccharide biosynthesis protein [uncultured Tateyamaria sp.]|uniref:exopolysaccharide biosynthesis protein n=1 Tax=uncultured Tateyamaria sp. TaxID=455651 RepID=UPI002605CA05|nr:exopolysaccharide biosynthesis protein [uncultured Tateyamaria sp.]